MTKISGKLIGDKRAFGGALEAFAGAGLELQPEAPPSFAAVSLPPKEAFKESLAALRGGLHVVCFPPFCLSVTEHGELRAAAAEAGCSFFPVHHWSRSVAFRSVARALDNEFAGKPGLISIEAGLPRPATGTPETSPELYQAFTELLSAARRPPTSLSARLYGKEQAACHVQLGDLDGFVHIMWNAPVSRFRLVIAGDKGLVETDGHSFLLGRSGGAQGTDFDKSFFPGTDADCLAAELRDFRREMAGEAVRGGGIRNSLYAIRLLKNAAYSSSIRSASVPL